MAGDVDWATALGVVLECAGARNKVACAGESELNRIGRRHGWRGGRALAAAYDAPLRQLREDWLELKASLLLASGGGHVGTQVVVALVATIAALVAPCVRFDRVACVIAALALSPNSSSAPPTRLT